MDMDLFSPEDAKARGNELFRQGAFDDAVEAYGECVALFTGTAALAPMAGPARDCLIAALANRAAALLRLRRPSDAESDCSRVLGLCNGQNLKARFRRAQARRMLASDALRQLGFGGGAGEDAGAGSNGGTGQQQPFRSGDVG